MFTFEMQRDSFTVLNITDMQLNEYHYDKADPRYDHSYDVMDHTIRTLVERVKPDSVQVAFDLHAPTFRHKMYEGYKAHRHGMDEELRCQMAPAKELLAALGYGILSLEGYEADDILGTISKRAEQEEAFC